MNYQTIKAAILTAIEKSPLDRGAYTDLFSAAQRWEVETILSNESTYRGNYRYGKESSENTHEPILTDVESK